MPLYSTPVIAINENYLQVVTNATTQLIVKILDKQGHFITTIKQTLEEGIHQFCIYLGELSGGTYVVNAFSGDKFIRSLYYVKA